MLPALLNIVYNTVVINSEGGGVVSSPSLLWLMSNEARGYPLFSFFPSIKLLKGGKYRII